MRMQRTVPRASTAEAIRSTLDIEDHAVQTSLFDDRECPDLSVTRAEDADQQIQVQSSPGSDISMRNNGSVDLGSVVRREEPRDVERIGLGEQCS
jgi:hypothetical protein